MASVQTVEKLTAELAQKLYDFDPDGTGATAVNAAWIDMSEAESILFALFRSVGTGSVTSFAIQASDSSDGSNPVTVRSHAIGSAPNAVGDQIFLECTAQELAALGTGLRYVMAVIALVTGTDECVVAATRKMKHKKSGNTADYIS